MPITALLFTLIASLIVWLGGRHDSTRAHRLTAVVIGLLLAYPLLTLLPKLSLLPAARTTSDAAADTATFLQWIWLAGASLLSVRVLVATLSLERWRSESQLLEQVPLARRQLEIRSLSTLHSPVAAGVLRPVVFVPQDWSTWQAEVREMVLAHEIAHHRRFDPLWRSLGALACALHWFNPMVWWLVRHHATQAEFACDAMVIRQGVKARSYATLLCDLASSEPSPLPAVAISERSSLARRVSRLMNPVGTISPAISAAMIGIVIVAAVIMAVIKRAEPAPSAVPALEIQTRLSADPFPGNP